MVLRPDPTRPAAIARGHIRREPRAAIGTALTRADYARVVIGGGIRKHEPLLGLFEKVVNLVRQDAPGAAIAFNTTPEDTADAALRWLR
jgi:hypothetical protein